MNTMGYKNHTADNVGFDQMVELVYTLGFDKLQDTLKYPSLEGLVRLSRGLREHKAAMYRWEYVRVLEYIELTTPTLYHA